MIGFRICENRAKAAPITGGWVELLNAFFLQPFTSGVMSTVDFFLPFSYRIAF